MIEVVLQKVGSIRSRPSTRRVTYSTKYRAYIASEYGKHWQELSDLVSKQRVCKGRSYVLREEEMMLYRFKAVQRKN